jgi:hypothetical protein
MDGRPSPLFACLQVDPGCRVSAEGLQKLLQGKQKKAQQDASEA